MSYNQGPGYFHGQLNEQQKVQRYQILKDLQSHVPAILFLENVVNDSDKYPNKLLDDILFELNFVPENKFDNKALLKGYYDGILTSQNEYYAAVYQLNKPQTESLAQTISQSPNKSEEAPRHHSNPQPQHSHNHPHNHHHGHSHGHHHQKHEQHHKPKYVAKEVTNSQDQQKKKSIRSQIIYDMNHISPSNLKEIQHTLIKYALYDQNLCKVLVEEILKKAWEQPQKAEIFAELCHFISNRKIEQFTFVKDHTQIHDNPFKYHLIQSVQTSFDEATEYLVKSSENPEKFKFLKKSKKKLISKVIFVAQLILRKVLKIRVIRYCIYHLLDSFLKHYYKFTQEKKFQDSIYEYYYEVIIYFIDHLGAKFDSLNDKQSKKQWIVDLNRVKKYFEESLNGSTLPNNELYDLLHYLSGDEYVQLLQFIDEIFISNRFPEQSILLQNLLKRVQSKWQIQSQKPYLQFAAVKIQPFPEKIND